MKTRMLILVANPVGTGPIRLDKEVREIQLGLRRSLDKRLSTACIYGLNPRRYIWIYHPLL
jgi:hypothetical protein